jgi:ribose transport system permease protein
VAQALHAAAVVSPEQRTQSSSGGLAPGQSTPERGRFLRPEAWTATVLRKTVLITSYVVMLLVFILAAHGFATKSNLDVAVDAAVVPALLAVSVTVVLVMGQFDLSGPAVASLASIAIALTAGTGGLHSGAGWLLAIAAGIAIGVALGAVNGVGVAYGRASSFIVTLAVSSLAGGLELYLQSKIPQQGTTINSFQLPKALRQFTLSTVGGFALYVVVAAAVVLVFWLLLARSTFGRHAHALGGNEMAARLAGVPVRRTKVIGFVATGAIAALAGVVLVSSQGYFPDATPGYLLPAYAAAFFGAAAVGRRGFSVPATLFGVLYLETLANGLQVLNQQPYVISLVQGAVLLVTVLVARAEGS